MFAWFEKLVHPYPDAPPATPPRGFFPFLWECTRGLRSYLLAMTLLTAVIGVFEALLFSMMGHIVDWLAEVKPADLWTTQRSTLLLLGAVLAGSMLLVALQSTIKQQALAGNFPMLLRWNFHRLLLGQSMGFYQDEFAGRIATKVMQTALAVRDVWLILAELLVFVIIYFVTMLVVLGGFDLKLLGAFFVWVVLYVITLRVFVPRLGRVAREQADARSLMTGRITDAYTNIATVKLFSHARREAGFAKAAMQEFLGTVQRQMRLVTGFEIVNHALSMALIASHRRRHAVAVDAGSSRRRRGRGGHRNGAATQRHLALGDVGDGGAVRAHRHRAGRHQHARARRIRWSTSPTRSRWSSRAARSASRTCSFSYGGKTRSSTTCRW